MATKIRLQRHGKKGKPFFHIVVTDSRARRDGKYIERVGFYNPTTVPASIDLDIDRSLYWVQRGAEPSETVNAILRYKGVLYKKHLYKGVDKGAFSAEEAEKKFEEWQDTHHASIDHKRTKHKEERDAQVQAIVTSGVAAAAARKKAKEVAAEEAAAAAEAEANPVEEVDTTEEITENSESDTSDTADDIADEVSSTPETVEDIQAEETAVAPLEEEPVAEETQEAAAEEATADAEEVNQEDVAAEEIISEETAAPAEEEAEEKE